MKFLYVAELVGKAGIYAFKKALPELKRSRGIDFTLVCADGATGGSGLGRNHAAYIRKLGADVITTGECCFYKKDLVENWPKLPYVLRPSNMGAGSPGFGWRVFYREKPNPQENGKRFSKDPGPDNRENPCPVAVLVLLGTNFNRLRVNNPFADLKPLLEKLRSETPYVIVDFHAWASGEKRTFFAAAAGLCTAVIGSHNRVQTTDEEVLSGGTAVICDAGRTGSAESVGGTDIAERIREYLTGIPNWTREAWDKPELQGVIVEAGDDGRALTIERLRIPVAAPEPALQPQ